MLLRKGTDPIRAVCISTDDMNKTLRMLIPAALLQHVSTDPPGQKRGGEVGDGDGTSKKTKKKKRSARELLRLSSISVVKGRIDKLKAEGKWGPAQQQSLQRYFSEILAHANPTPKRPRETPAAAAPETDDVTLPVADEPVQTRKRKWHEAASNTTHDVDGPETLSNCLQRCIGGMPEGQQVLSELEGMAHDVDKMVLTLIIYRSVLRCEFTPSVIEKSKKDRQASFTMFVRTRGVSELWSADPHEIVEEAMAFNHAEKREVVPQCYVNNRPRQTIFTQKNAQRTLGKMGLESTECDFAELQRRFNDTASSQGWNAGTPLGTPFEQCVIILEPLEAKAGEPSRCGLFVVYQICTDKDKLDRYMKDQKKTNISATVDCWDLENDWTSYTTNKMACDVFLDQPRTFKVVTRKGA